MVKKRSEMTPEELKEAQRAYGREYYQKKRANMTPEQKAERSARQLAYWEREIAQMTSEELEELRASKREYARQRYASMIASMSPEERVEFQKSRYNKQKSRAWERSLNAETSAKRSNHNG